MVYGISKVRNHGTKLPLPLGNWVGVRVPYNGFAATRNLFAKQSNHAMSDELRVLIQYPADLRPQNLTFLASAGGMSGAQFWQIAAPRGPFILRRWPVESPSPDRLKFIHAVLQHAAKRGIAIVPLPATTATGQTFVQQDRYLWQLDPQMPGAADYRNAPSAEKFTAAMHSLAAFHNAVADFPADPSHARSPKIAADLRSAGPQPATLRHFTRLRDLQSSTTLAQLADSITPQAFPDLAPLAQEFLLLLPKIIPRAQLQLAPLAGAVLPLQPCIRDIWHDHILFTGNRVTGIVDFGALDIDTPATDIARLLGSLSESPLPIREGPGEGSDSTANTWQLGLSAYQQIRPLTADELRATHALAVSGNILAGCNWIRWLYVENRQFENATPIIERFRHIVARSREIAARA